MNKKRYQSKIVLTRQHIREGKLFDAYDILGQILEDMNKDD